MMILFVMLALGNGVLLMTGQLINAALGMRTSALGSSWINHVVGALFGGFLLLCGLGAGQLLFSGVPFIYFLGGCIGVVVVALFNFSAPRVGAAFMSVLWTSAQLLTSSLIDHFGILGTVPVPFTWYRFTGVVFLILAARLVFSKE